MMFTENLIDTYLAEGTIKVTHLGSVGSEMDFQVVWPDGTTERYLVNPYLGGKLLVQLRHGAHGKVANQLKKVGRRISHKKA